MSAPLCNGAGEIVVPGAQDMFGNYDTREYECPGCAACDPRGAWIEQEAEVQARIVTFVTWPHHQDPAWAAAQVAEWVEHRYEADPAVVPSWVELASRDYEEVADVA